MTQEALKLALEYLESRGLAWNVQIALREALREHALKEVQRLGQEIEQEPWCMKMNGCKTKCEDCPVEVVEPEQEPFAWFRYQQGSRVYYDTKKWDDCQPLYTQSASDYERGFIDGMQKQMQSSVDRAVNAMSQRTWVGLTDDERESIANATIRIHGQDWAYATAIEAKLKDKNNAT